MTPVFSQDEQQFLAWSAFFFSVLSVAAVAAHVWFVNMRRPK